MEDNDSRLCIKMNAERNQFNFIHQNMNIVDAREIAQRIATFIRNIQSGVRQSKDVIDSYEVYPIPTDEMNKVCIVWNPETHQIRFAVDGMDLWDAAIACDHAVGYFNSMMFNPVEIQAKEYANVRTDDR
jgi:hypothetical protein